MKTFFETRFTLSALIAGVSLLLVNLAMARTPTTLHSPTAGSGANTNSDGVSPQAGLILSGNILHGTASNGGTNANGRVSTRRVTPDASSGSDLSLSVSTFPQPPSVGSLLGYTLTVSNAGPSIATNVVVSNTVPASVTFIDAAFTGSSSGIMPTNGVLFLNIGSLAVGASNVVNIVVRPNATGPLTNLFAVSSDASDPVPANNSVTVVSLVTNALVLTNIVLYTVVDLGDLGASNSEAYAINNPGQIVGNATIPGGNGHAVFWTNILTPPINIGDTNVGLGSQAVGINNSGQIVGNFNETTFFEHAAFWTNSASPPFDLGTLGGTISEAMGINAAGQIVGDATTATPLDHACFWTNSSSPAVDLGTLGGNSSTALGINASGQIAGQAMDAGGIKHAAFWTNSSSPAVELDDGASTNSTAISINDLGQIVGYNLEQGALFWTNHASPPLNLGTIPGYGDFSQPGCINHSGQIVGISEITNNIKTYLPLTATLWMSPTNPAQDLNTLIATNSGWVLLEAYGINDSGVIVGDGAVTNAGAPHGVVLHAFALIPVNQNTNADLSLSVTESPNPVNVAVSNLMTYTITVSNAGPATATDVTVSNQIFTQSSGIVFISATGGSTPTNGILLMNLGSLAPGATNVAQINAYLVRGGPASFYTNNFQVYADQTDPNPNNNSATAIFQGTGGNITQFTTSTAEYNTTNTTTVSQQVTNYTTELIARLPNGTVVYDQTFNAAYANAAVQSAIAAAAVDLTNAGAAAYTGPAQTGLSLTTNNSSVTVNGGTNINLIVGTKVWVGPQTISVGNFGVVTGYTFDPVVTNYAIPTGGNPGSLTLNSGQTDNDTMILSLFDFLLTTTNTATYTNSSVYVMTGVAAQATPGTPIAWGNPGGGIVTVPYVGEAGDVISIATRFGILSAENNNYYGAFTSAVPGDIVMLLDPTGGNNPTNWAALVRLFNPNDPTGSNGLAATDYEAFLPATAGPNGFTNFQLFPNVIYMAAELNNPGPDEITTTAIVFGPVEGILAGQEALIGFTAALRTTNNITAPVPGQQVSNAVFTVMGTTTSANDITTVANVYVQLNGGGWTNATTGNGWSNWSANVTLTPGSNTVQAYAVDNFFGTPSATNSVTFEYAPQFIPGTPLTISGSNPGGNFAVSYDLVFGSGPIVGGVSGGFTTVTATPGDLILLNNPSGGSNPTNWAAIARFFNPADPTGSNGLAATESEAFFSTNYGGSGFAGFQLFPNADFLPAGSIATSNGVTTINSQYTEFGPAGVFFAGQEDANLLTVTSPFTDLSLSASAAPQPVTVGSNLVYTLTVSNAFTQYAPQTVTATGVVVSNRIPANVTFVSATGGATPTNGVLLLNLGSLAEGTNTSVQIIVQPTTAGNLTNTFQVFANQFDPNLTNNSATVISTVTNAPVVSQLIPGTPLTVSGSVPAQSFISTYDNVFGNGPIEGGNADDFTTLTATPGDLVLLIDPTGGNNPTNWAAVVRFYNPSDLTGSDGLAATESQAFFATILGGSGFNGLQLFPNTDFIPAAGIATSNGITTVTAEYTEFGPAGVFPAGETDINVVTATSDYTDLSLTASASSNTVYIGTLGGSNLVYTVTVSNAGPATATGVVVSNQPPGNFVSATGGAALTNGVLLLNLGSLAVGATNSAQIVVNMTGAGIYTNIFRVFADEFDPNLTNNSATVVTDVIGTNSTVETTSAGEYDTTNTTTVSQQVTNYSTELIAKLPNGTVVYDQTFNAAFANAAVQAAITTAAVDLTNAGATSYTGPAQTSFLQITNSSSVTVPTSTNANYIIGSKAYIGPQTILIGNFGQIQGYTFDPIVTNYFIPTSWNGNPTSFSILPGEQDVDTRVLSLVNINQTTTNTSLYTNSSVYVMTGIVAQADLSLSASWSFSSNLLNNVVFSITVSNAGPSAATGVTISNQIPTNATYISVTGGTTPTNGALVVNLGLLAVGATNSIQITAAVQPPVFYDFTNVFQVFANQTDPVLTNNSASARPDNTEATTTSTLVHDTNLTSTVNQQVTNYSTELIAKLPNGTVVYDQTFNVAYSNATVQAAITTAAVDLTNAGAASYTGPTETNSSQTLAGSFSVAVTNIIGTNLSVVATPYIGPQTIMVGDNQSQTLTIPPGAEDIDTLITYDVTNLVTTTNTDTYSNSAVYVMIGTVAQADLSLTASTAPNPVGVGSNLVYSILITNLGPSAASGVVISNHVPAGVNFVSATGGSTPSGGVLLLNLGSLATSAVTNAQVIVQPPAAGKLTNLFQVFASTADPDLTNNSATVVSTVTNPPPVLADLSLSASAAPEPVGVGSSLVYTILITNLGPSAASGVVVSNRIPVNVNFVSATGGSTPSGGILLLNLGSLPVSAGGSAQVIVQPTVAGKLTNLFEVSASQTDPDLTNNTATEISMVTNAPSGNSKVDVALSITAAPNPVDVGSPLTYLLTVTNNSSTTATGVVVSNFLPCGVTLISVLPSQGSDSTNGEVIKFNVGTLPNGVEVTLAIVVIPNAAGCLTDKAVASSTQPDSQPTNNSVQIMTSAVIVPVTNNLVLTVLSPISSCNQKTGLSEQQVQVHNDGPLIPSWVRVLVSGLPANATLYNASGVTNGTPYVQSNSPLGVGSNVVFLLEYYVPNHVTPANLTFTVQAGPPVTPPVGGGTNCNISRMFRQSDGCVQFEFSAMPGRMYAIQYSSDLVTWRTATPAITAPTNCVQWIDSGPPLTCSSPAQQGARFYRVVLLLAN